MGRPCPQADFNFYSNFQHCHLFAVDLPQVNTPAHDSTYWTIVGISVGAVSLLVLILLLVTLSACCCICIKRKQTKKSTE